MVAETYRETTTAMLLDPEILVATRQHELLAEADHDRLAARLPKSHSSMRHDLAHACLGLANWLDGASEQLPGLAEMSTSVAPNRDPRTGRLAA